MGIATIEKWEAICECCNNSIKGRDVIRPGQPLDRMHEHVNPSDMYLPIPGTGGAHSSWPAAGTIRVTATHTI